MTVVYRSPRVASASAVAALLLAGACKTTASPAPGAPPPVDAALAPTSSTPMNALPMPSSSVSAQVNPEGLPAYDGPTGSVQGTIYITGDPPKALPGQSFSKCPDAKAEYGPTFRAGAPLADGRRPLADAVVVVTGYSGFYLPEQHDSRLITFDGCGFPLLTYALTFGQRLDISNKTKLLFAPELAQAPRMSIGMPPPEEACDPVHIYPPHPGSFALKDKINMLPYLRAEIIVLRQPLHTESDVAGHYRIDGVPVGKQLQVNAELPITQSKASQKVDVVSGVVATVDIVLHWEAPDAAGFPAPAGSLPHIH